MSPANMTEILNNKEKDTACIIVNWKKPEKTAACIMRVLASELCPSLIYIIDNHSEDNSQEKILNLLLRSNIRKKLENRLIWIDTLENIGYAGANNIGLREIHKINHIGFIWIINNDLQVEKNTLSSMREHLLNNPDTGFVGTPIVFEKTNKLQCYGGGLHTPYLGINRLLYKGKTLNSLPIPKRIPDYIMGCNLLTRRQVIASAGYMDEDYFMYSEEIDWQIRAKSHDWKVDVTDKSFASHGTLEEREVRDYSYYYYKNRSAVRFVKKHYGMIWAAIALLVHLPVIFLDKPKRKHFTSALQGLLDGLKM
jgi:GT2 family glycosyltransferase